MILCLAITSANFSELKSAPVILNWHISLVTTGFYPLILKSNLTSAFWFSLTGFFLHISLQTASSSLTTSPEVLFPTRPMTKLSLKNTIPLFNSFNFAANWGKNEKYRVGLSCSDLTKNRLESADYEFRTSFTWRFNICWSCFLVTVLNFLYSLKNLIAVGKICVLSTPQVSQSEFMMSYSPFMIVMALSSAT